MSRQRKQYSIVLYDSKGNYLKEIPLDSNMKPTIKRFPMSKAKYVDLYYGETLKESFAYDKVKTPSSQKKLLAFSQAQKTERKREKRLKEVKKRKVTEKVVKETYRLYDKNKKLLSPTNFRSARFFAIIKGGKKIYVDDFKGLKTREDKIDKIRRWRTDETDVAVFPTFKVKTVVQEVVSRDNEPFRIRKHYGIYNSPITVPHLNKIELTKFLSRIKEDVRKLFLKEWSQSSGTERMFIFKVFTPMYNDLGKLVSEGAHYIEEGDGVKKLTYDKLITNYSYGFSNARTALTTSSQFDLAWSDLEQRWARMMGEYVSRSMANFMTTVGFMVENVL